MNAPARVRSSFVMGAREALFYRANGYLLRERVFEAAECAAILQDSEILLADLAAQPNFKRAKSGTFTFDRLEDLETSVKWERGENEDNVRGVEPFAHLSESLNACANDPRLADPSTTPDELPA